jgi:peptidoglycan/LPS O-acetylase OafA/YrhL
LRAVAVIAVILNHVLNWPTGGFVGVDVFFVISGFLITGLLLRDYESDGKISIARFYARRFKRIVPAAVTVLLVTVVAGHFLFNTVREWATIWDAGYAFLFLANLHFGALGTDYFHALGPVSPLQHYWSLSLEEQFYLVWPGLVAIVLALAAGAAGKRGTGRVAVGVVAGVLVAASFIWALTETANSPTAAYFSTLSRAWELGVGALLAAAVPVLGRLPFAARFVFGWVGLVGIGAAFWLITDQLSFPGPWAALPVVATALVIIGGIGGPQRYLFPLHNPVSVWLGSISYSLYLWHFPVIAFLLILVPTQTALTTGVVLAIILAISVVAYYLVEQPFHRSPLFERYADDPDADVSPRTAAWDSWRDRFGAQFMGSAVGLAVVVLAIVLLAGNSLRGENQMASPENSAGVEDQLQADLASAVTATTWPTDLAPSLDSVMTTTTLDNAARGCFEVGATPSIPSCTWGLASAPHQMYLVGDSTALAYAPAFKAIAEASEGEWKITTIGLFGCRFTDVLVQNDGAGVMDSCPTRKADVAAQIVADHPDLVVISNAYTEGNGVDGSPLSAEAIVKSTLAEAAKYDEDGHLVFLAPPPLGADLGSCYSPVTSPQSCTTTVGATWKAFAKETADTAGTGNTFISSLPYSCFDGSCPAFAGTLPTKFDSTHMTVAYSVHVAPAIRNALVAAGLL